MPFSIRNLSLIAIAAAFALPLHAAKTEGSKGPASVVITVGPSKIRKRQIDTLMDLMMKVKRTQGDPSAEQKLGMEKMIATNLIGQELLDLEAKRLNVVAGETEIDSLLRIFRANFPSDDAFRDALKQAGDTEKGLHEKLARQVRSDKLLNTQVSPVARPSHAEQLAFFNAHKSEFPFNDSLRACQILFMLDPKALPNEVQDKKEKLEQIRAALSRDSGDIDALLTRFVIKARDVSDGPEKKDGGDLQRFNPSDFNPEFKKQVTGLKVGQMSPVFRTPLGWHLVLLTERNDGKFESYQLQIAHLLVQEKAAKAGKDLKKYLQGLAERYKVKYLEQEYRDSSVAGVYDP